MKKIYILMTAICLLLTSCNSDNNSINEKNIEKKSDTVISNENNHLIIKDNISNLDYSIEIGKNVTTQKKAFTQQNKIQNSYGLSTDISVNFDGDKLFTISSNINDIQFYIEQINETEFYILNEEKNKMQKISISLDEKSNLTIKTLKIYADNIKNNQLIALQGQWYGCMRERLGDPINIAILGFSSFLGPVGLAGAFTGIGLYCAF